MNSRRDLWSKYVFERERDHFIFKKNKIILNIITFLFKFDNFKNREIQRVVSEFELNFY